MKKQKSIWFTLLLILILVITSKSCDNDDSIISELEGEPFAITQQVTNVMHKSATLNGFVTPNGLLTDVVFDYGLTKELGNTIVACQSPIDGVSKIIVSAEIISLKPATNYYFRIRAENEAGVSYGNSLSFRTYNNIVNDIDDNVYGTVVIGNQEWMAVNLRVTKYKNGDNLLIGPNNTDGAYRIFPFCDFHAAGINSDEEMVTAYGKRYNWYAVDDTRGLCPEGWNVPSAQEWRQLVDYVVDQGYPNEPDNPSGAAIALRSCRQLGTPLNNDCNVSEHPRWNAHYEYFGTDDFGFSALPGGFGDHYLGHFGTWWTSTNPPHPSIDPVAYYINGERSYVTSIWLRKNTMLSVRCIKNTE